MQSLRPTLTNQKTFARHSRVIAWLSLTLTPVLAGIPSAWAAKPAAKAAPTQPIKMIDETWRDKQPAAGPETVVQPPQPQRWTLPVGLEVVLLTRPQLPVVTLSFVFPGGNRLDPPGLQGQTAACIDLATDGTKALDKIAWSEALADIAASITSWTSSEEMGFRASTLQEHLDRTLDLLADAMTQPGLRQDEFDRLIAKRKAALQAQRGSPGAVGKRIASSVFWGPEHAYGQVSTEASYAKLKVDACQPLISKQIVPGGARLYVAGAIDRQTLEPKLLRAFQNFSTWKGTVAASSDVGAAKPRKGQLFFVNVPGAAQSMVLVAHSGPARKSPDFDATSVLSSVLASGFASRINMNIREKHGYAYGAGGGFDYERLASLFVVQASVRADVTAASISEILFEMKDIQTRPATSEELQREKEGAIRALPARWANLASAIESFRILDYFGLPADEYATRPARLAKIDSAQVQAAALAHIRPQQVQIVVVGDAATVLPQLQTLAKQGLVQGEIQQLDTDGGALPSK